MNKEEMLQSLKDLKFNINGGLVDNETKEKLEGLEIDLNLLDDEIFELTNKIEDDTNYPTFFALYDEAEISNAKRELNIAKAGLESTKLTIAQVEEYIAYIKREIEENNKKMNELNAENLEQGARLRELGITPNVEEENLIRETLNTNRNEISKINIKNDRARQVLAENEKQLKTLLEHKSDFENKMNNAQINLNNAESLQASRPLVNEAKRNIDREELNDLKYIKSTMENEKTALSINLADEIDKIINDLQNDVITVDDINGKLEELKRNVPGGYFNADIEDRNNELVHNRKVQVELEDKINNLTAKVNNIDNYKLSEVEMAREEEKVKVLAVRVQNSNLKIAELEKSKQQLESELASQNKKVESREVENKIIALKGQLRKAKTDEEKQQISKEIELSQKEAWNDLNELTDKKAELEAITASLVTEESNLQRYIKLHENAVNRKEDLNKRLDNNEVQNTYQRRLDEMELAKSKASLEALKNRAQFISLPVLEQVNNLIGKNVRSNVGIDEKEETVFKGKNGEEIKIETPLPFENDLGVKDASFDEKTNQIYMDEPKTNDLEGNILNALNNDPNLEGFKFSFPNEEENKEEEIAPILNPEIDVDNQELNTPEEELNIEEEEKEEEKETKVVPIVGKMKAKFKDASEKLKNKAKDLNFKAKLKKWAKVIAVVAASAVLLVSSGKLPHKTLENLQDPKVIEQIDNEELDPNEMIQEDEKEEVKEEENKEEVVEENKEEVVEENNNNVIEDKKENENKTNEGVNPINKDNNNNNNNNSNNNNNNNSNESKPKDDHDNSDEITVPEEDNNNNNNQDDITIDEDTPVEEIVDDAIIEDDEENVIDDENNDAIIEDDEENNIDDENNDAIIDDENEEVFDNEDQFENDENNDAIIDDENEEENVFDNEDQFDNNDNENNDGVVDEEQNEEENVFDNEDQFDNNENNDGVIDDNQQEEDNVYDNEDQFDNNENENNNDQNNEEQDNVYDNYDQFEENQNDNSTNDEPVVEEEVYDNLGDIEDNVQDNVQDNTQEEVYDNSNDVQNTDQIEVLPGETYLNDQQEEVYTNGGNIDDAIEKEPNIESIEQGEDKDILNVYTNEEEISYNSEIEQLKQLREYYANNTIEEENSMTRSL